MFLIKTKEKDLRDYSSCIKLSKEVIKRNKGLKSKLEAFKNLGLRVEYDSVNGDVGDVFSFSFFGHNDAFMKIDNDEDFDIEDREYTYPIVQLKTNTELRIFKLKNLIGKLKKVQTSNDNE